MKKAIMKSVLASCLTASVFLFSSAAKADCGQCAMQKVTYYKPTCHSCTYRPATFVKYVPRYYVKQVPVYYTAPVRSCQSGCWVNRWNGVPIPCDRLYNSCSYGY